MGGGGGGVHTKKLLSHFNYSDFNSRSARVKLNDYIFSCPTLRMGQVKMKNNIARLLKVGARE